MHVRTYPLALSADPVIDCDLLPNGELVVVTGGTGTHTLFVAGRKVGLPASVRFPIVRAIDTWRILLVDVRTQSQHPNAWVLTAGGKVDAQFRVGDAVADVIPFEHRVAVTYFDEAVGNADGWIGVVVFDYQGGVQAQQEFADCYCACRLPAQRMLFLAYPEFDVVRLQVTTGQVQRWPAPAALHGASAMTARGDDVFVHGPYGDDNGLYHWVMGAREVRRIGDYNGAVRGIGQGRFLTHDQHGYGILMLDADQTGDNGQLVP